MKPVKINNSFYLYFIEVFKKNMTIKISNGLNKKIFLTLFAAVAVIAGVVGLSAFEAHIINVTAHIENALKVDTTPIAFGTVFPQEYLERNFSIALSDSFAAADRVDDVEYKIVQKPKCKADDPENPVVYAPVDRNTHLCPQGYTAMLSLCPYLSKTTTDTNDVGVPGYYNGPGKDCTVRTGEEVATGRLSKEDQDISDTWTVDLKVPPVEGTIAQDWAANCPIIPENDKDYGCDLWVEVEGISLPGTSPTPTPTPEICDEQGDVMLILDRSGSISDSELVTLKTASHAFVTALAPDGGVHMGQTSFSDNGTLDLHLTGNVTDINNAISALVSGGFTNLSEGLQLANGELNDSNLPYERPLVPDFMVVITDGEPNRPTDEPTAQAAAAAQASAARAAGVQIYVVGIGVTPATETYLKTSIADDAAHYYSAADYSGLETLLQNIANCQD